jgi:tetratricopeptide (TPR) repeat protein
MAAEAQNSGEQTSVAPTTGEQTSGGTSSTAPTPTAALTDAQPGQGAAAATASPPGRASNAGDDPAAQSRAQMYKAWTAAREAFAKRKPEAVTAYIDLAKRYPDVPELTGELGNIYFQQGKMAEAATQYYETAQRLIRRGEPGPAACLIDVMRYLDAEKAKALESQTGVPCPVQRTQRN